MAGVMAWWKEENMVWVVERVSRIHSQDSELQRVVVRSALEGVLAQEPVKVGVLVRGK